MRVVELVGGTLALGVERTRADDEERQQRQRDDGTENAPPNGTKVCESCHLVDQKFISRLMWNTVPLAPTG